MRGGWGRGGGGGGERSGEEGGRGGGVGVEGGDFFLLLWGWVRGV